MSLLSSQSWTQSTCALSSISKYLGTCLPFASIHMRRPTGRVSSRIEWASGDKLDVLRTWIRNQHHDSIKTMHAFTKDDALTSILKGIDHLPVITIVAPD
jgi:hypothetical protein